MQSCIGLELCVMYGPLLYELGLCVSHDGVLCES